MSPVGRKSWEPQNHYCFLYLLDSWIKRSIKQRIKDSKKSLFWMVSASLEFSRICEPSKIPKAPSKSKCLCVFFLNLWNFWFASPVGRKSWEPQKRFVLGLLERKPHQTKGFKNPKSKSGFWICLASLEFPWNCEPGKIPKIPTKSKCLGFLFGNFGFWIASRFGRKRCESQNLWFFLFFLISGPQTF